MNKVWSMVVGGAVLGLVFALGVSPFSAAGAKERKMLSHDVFFTLKDSSAKNRQELIQACQKYLKGHPGEAWFAVGERCETLKREVNDQDYDVGLHIVFRDLAAHDVYQDAPRHKQFVEECKDTWKKVRVFNSYVAK